MKFIYNTTLKTCKSGIETIYNVYGDADCISDLFSKIVNHCVIY